jgi:hypothetical protein
MSEKAQPTLKDQVVGMMILTALGYGAWLYFAGNSSEPTPEEQAVAAAEQQVADAACRQSLQCWGDRHSVAASVRCPGEIERLPRFTMEWVDGWLEPKFSHFRWRDQEAGVVTYVGDRARFQNGFGAWQNVIYECDFDTQNDTVLNVRASAGRL